MSDSLEQCADAGRGFLFVQNNTVLGCGAILWTNNESSSYNGTLNTISVTSILSVSPSGTIISLPDREISSTIQPSKAVVFNVTNSMVPPKWSAVTNGDLNSTVTTTPYGILSATSQQSNGVVQMMNSSAPLNVSQTNGGSNGTMILSPNSASSTTGQPPNGTTNSSVQISTLNNSLQTAETTSQSNSPVYMTTSNNSYGVSNGTYLPSPNYSLRTTRAFSPTYVLYTSYLPSNGTVSNDAKISSSNGTLSINATMVPSSVMANVTNTLLASTVTNGTIWPNSSFLGSTTTRPQSNMVPATSSEIIVSDATFNGTKATPQNGTYSMIIQPSTTMLLYNLNSSQIKADGLSKTSSVGPNAASNLTTAHNDSSCNNSSTDNLTELVQAYKTELYGEVSIRVFTSTNYTILAGNLLSCFVCTFIPDDKTPDVLVKSVLSSVSFFHRYFKPGRYRSRIRCEQNETLVDVSRRVLVTLPVVHRGLICPSHYETNITYYCVFHVDQASILNVKVAIGSEFEKLHRFSGKILVSICSRVDSMHF